MDGRDGRASELGSACLTSLLGRLLNRGATTVALSSSFCVRHRPPSLSLQRRAHLDFTNRRLSRAIAHPRSGNLSSIAVNSIHAGLFSQHIWSAPLSQAAGASSPLCPLRVVPLCRRLCSPSAVRSHSTLR